jgi:enoyl-CoA hydratase/carnithine racemase
VISIEHEKWDEGKVAILRLSRPEKRNAMTPAMLTELEGALRRCAEARAVVISGEGSIFCAGFDLTLCQDDRGALEELLRGLTRVIVAMRETPCPVVVSAHGAAIAGGCAVAAAADILVTNTEAKLGYPVVRLGISPAVNAPVVAERMGHGGTRARLLDPQVISGTEAVRCGLACEALAEASAVEPRAVEIARALATKPRCGLEATKLWLERVSPAPLLDEALASSLELVGGEEENRLLPLAWRQR